MIRDMLFSVVALPVVFFMHYFVYCFLYEMFGTAEFWDILTIFLVTQGVLYVIVGMLLSAIFSTISMLHFTLWMSIAGLSIE